MRLTGKFQTDGKRAAYGRRRTLRDPFLPLVAGSFKGREK
jgi:hypothetical protein